MWRAQHSNVLIKSDIVCVNIIGVNVGIIFSVAWKNKVHVLADKMYCCLAVTCQYSGTCLEGPPVMMRDYLF